MVVCVECGAQVPSLYTEYSKGNIRLTQCEHCKCFADKYIEHDLLVIVIDMILHKPQVYRHLLFNRLSKQSKESTVTLKKDSEVDSNEWRLAILLVLFDVFLKYSQLEKSFKIARKSDFYVGYKRIGSNIDMFQRLLVDNPVRGYLHFLTLCVIETILVHSAVRLFTYWLLEKNKDRWRLKVSPLPIDYEDISSTLILSSFAKLLLILMIIWDFDPEYTWLVEVFSFTSNAEALTVLLGTNYFISCLILAFGLLAKLAFQMITRNFNVITIF